MIFKRAAAKLRAQDWVAITIELAIVTVGVLIALGAQQWADNRAQRDKMKVSMGAVRDELQEHYGYAVEYRVVYPCLQAQVDQLRERVLDSGATLNPAPLYHDEHFRYVLREPSKMYPTDAWDAAVNDGTTQRLDPAVRRALAGHYGQLPTIRELNTANNATEAAFVGLSHPLPLDASVRYSIIKDIEQLSGQMEYLDYLNGQVIDYIQAVHMLPPAEEARAVVERYGTYGFCRAHGLPTRSFKDAMVAVPN
jgi:hypothetical protein